MFGCLNRCCRWSRVRAANGASARPSPIEFPITRKSEFRTAWLIPESRNPRQPTRNGSQRLEPAVERSDTAG